MRDIEINLLLNKAEELKALFVLGQRVIPFLEEIFLFIREISPLLDEINVSIEENLSKMPTASKQLSKVTEATEVATTEILNTLDGLSYKADVISQNLKTLQTNSQQQKKLLLSVIDSLSAVADGRKVEPMPSVPGVEQDSIYRRISEIIRSFDSNSAAAGAVYHNSDPLRQVVKQIQDALHNDADSAAITNSEDLLESIRQDSMQMMMALQVQDITSQQLAAVNHLLQTVQKRLSEILIHFRNTEFSELMADDPIAAKSTAQVSQMHRTIAFDAEAVQAIEFKDTRQDSVDSIMASFQSGNNHPDQAAIDSVFNAPKPAAAPPTPQPKPVVQPPTQQTSAPASQNDIDALFSGKTAAPSAPAPIPAAAQALASGPASQDDIDALFGGNSSGPASQDDINALFGGNSSGPASQDDINALFGGNSSGPASQDDIDALFGGGNVAAPAKQQAPDLSAANSLGSGPVSQDDIDALFR